MRFMVKFTFFAELTRDYAMILQMTRPVQGGLRQERQFELIANHLANVSTAGFKGDILTFDQTMKAIQVVDHSQGKMRTTGNQLDVAISGQGFFKVQTPEGIRYTRAGNFTVDRESLLVTPDGHPVLGVGGPIVIRGTESDISQNISVGEDGTVQVDGDTVGQLSVVDFADIRQLRKTAGTLFVYDGPLGDEMAAQNAVVHQGTLEEPNISTAIEMTRMIQSHRLYEAYQKMVHSFDEINTRAVQEIGKF